MANPLNAEIEMVQSEVTDALSVLESKCQNLYALNFWQELGVQLTEHERLTKLAPLDKYKEDIAPLLLEHQEILREFHEREDAIRLEFEDKLSQMEQARMLAGKDYDDPEMVRQRQQLAREERRARAILVGLDRLIESSWKEVLEVSRNHILDSGLRQYSRSGTRLDIGDFDWVLDVTTASYILSPREVLHNIDRRTKPHCKPFTKLPQSARTTLPTEINVESNPANVTKAIFSEWIPEGLGLPVGTAGAMGAK